MNRITAYKCRYIIENMIGGNGNMRDLIDELRDTYDTEVSFLGEQLADINTKYFKLTEHTSYLKKDINDID